MVERCAPTFYRVGRSRQRSLFAHHSGILVPHDKAWASGISGQAVAVEVRPQSCQLVSAVGMNSLTFEVREKQATKLAVQTALLGSA